MPLLRELWIYQSMSLRISELLLIVYMWARNFYCKLKPHAYVRSFEDMLFHRCKVHIVSLAGAALGDAAGRTVGASTSHRSRYQSPIGVLRATVERGSTPASVGGRTPLPLEAPRNGEQSLFSYTLP